MDIFEEIEVIIFDFDGVIVDSMDVRDYGFKKILENYPCDKVEKLINYHRENGGLSRFHKIKYFYNEIIKEEISEEKIIDYSNKFSSIMREELTKERYIILECIEFIADNTKNYDMHIASGSEEKELIYLCEKLGIAKYFKSINGSPTHKNELVKTIIEKNRYSNEKVVLIGDSINDYEAAKTNDISFIGYNNIELKHLDALYLDKLI